MFCSTSFDTSSASHLDITQKGTHGCTEYFQLLVAVCDHDIWSELESDLRTLFGDLKDRVAATSYTCRVSTTGYPLGL